MQVRSEVRFLQIHKPYFPCSHFYLKPTFSLMQVMPEVKYLHPLNAYFKYSQFYFKLILQPLSAYFHTHIIITN